MLSLEQYSLGEVWAVRNKLLLDFLISLKTSQAITDFSLPKSICAE